MKGQIYDNRTAQVAGESARAGVTGYRPITYYRRVIEPGKDMTIRTELWLEIVEPAPDVLRRFSRVTRGGHNGGWHVGSYGSRPRLSAAVEAAEQLVEYERTAEREDGQVVRYG